MNKILSGDDANTTLDGFRSPDGDPVLVINGKPFRFCIGSQPFEQTEIYILGAKLVDAIIKYKNTNTKDNR